MRRVNFRNLAGKRGLERLQIGLHAAKLFCYIVGLLLRGIFNRRKLLRNFDISEDDTALVVSSSGCNVVPIEIAEQFQQRGVWVAGLVSLAHCEGSESKRDDGKKLVHFSDRVLDTGAPLGDSMIQVDGLPTPVSPGSTVGGCMIVNALKAEIARLLTESGNPPRVLTSSAIVGKKQAEELFESAYDEHSRRMAVLYGGNG